jgi:hypothetical protein
MDRAQALNAAKVKMFVDDTDYMNAVNSFDNPRIKEYSEQVIKDLGKYINENPEIDSTKGNFGDYTKKFYFNLL